MKPNPKKFNYIFWDSRKELPPNLTVIDIDKLIGYRVKPGCWRIVALELESPDHDKYAGDFQNQLLDFLNDNHFPVLHLKHKKRAIGKVPVYHYKSTEHARDTILRLLEHPSLVPSRFTRASRKIRERRKKWTSKSQ